MVKTARRALRIAGYALAGLLALLVVYGLAGLIGAALPANSGWRPPERGVVIYVETNGIHTDLVLPVQAEGVDWRTVAHAADLRDPRYGAYDHIAIGWGERDFYLNTPEWSDVRLDTVIGAAFGSRDTLIHVAFLPPPVPASDVRRIVLRPDEYRRLAAFIRGYFVQGQRGRTIPFPGYGDYDIFYASNGYYDAFVTCNSWTGDALRHAGVRVGRWTPFAAGVMGWF